MAAIFTIVLEKLWAKNGKNINFKPWWDCYPEST